MQQIAKPSPCTFSINLYHTRTHTPCKPLGTHQPTVGTCHYLHDYTWLPESRRKRSQRPAENSKLLVAWPVQSMHAAVRTQEYNNVHPQTQSNKKKATSCCWAALALQFASPYSLCIYKESYLGKRDRFQNLTLTPYFYIKMFIKKWYIHIFMKIFFKINLFI